MNTRKGFTLVELLVVIAILAILATVSVVGYTSFINRAHESNAQTEAHQIESAIESYTMAGNYYILNDTQLVDKDMKVYEYTEEDGVITKGDQVAADTVITLDDDHDFYGLGTLTVNASGYLVYTTTTYTTGVVIK